MTGRLANKRILLLEDDYLVATMTAEMLHDLGAAVVGPLPSISQAMEVARRHTLDAAVLDVNISGTSSAPVATELKARRIPFVFSTGYGEAPAGPWPAVPVIAKPYQEDDLEAALCRALDLAL